MDDVITLNHAASVVPQITGGKAASLAQLRQAGVAVLDGIVITTDAVQRIVDAAMVNESADDEDPSSCFERAGFDPELGRIIRRHLSALGDCFVVRSSGVQEDGASASWAGQLESIIGVGLGRDLERAIMRCIGSMFSERAAAYRGSRADGALRLAVLIQPVLNPVCAGVMFTVNPVTGSWREMTVEAAWGQAAPVVGGEIVPDFYRVRRPRNTPRPVQRILSRIRLDLVEERVRPQSTQWAAGPDGLHAIAVAPSRRSAPKLRHQQIMRLCRLGLRVESLRRGPQDVEWALTDGGRLVVLQARPVTTNTRVTRAGPTLWSRRFIGERWTEPATPLGWSLMHGLLEEYIGYPRTTASHLGGGESMQLVRFAPYINVSVFRHLAFKLPGAPPPQFMMELLPAAEQRAWRRRHAQRPDFAVYGSLLSETVAGTRWKQFSPGLWSNPRRWRSFLARLEKELPALCRPGETVMEAHALSSRCRVLARQYIGIHVCSLLWANLLHQISSSAMEGLGHAPLTPDALRPVEENWTVKTNHALWRLGRGDLSLDGFMHDFGHRASSSWELFSPRWRESPDAVLALAASAAQHNDPHQLAVAQAQRAQAAVRSLSGWLRPVVALTQTYLGLRENQRFHYDRLLDAWGGQLKRLEALTRVELRFLQAAEVQRLVDGSMTKTDARTIADARRVEWVAECERRNAGDEPPNFLVGAEALVEQVQGIRMQGVGVSPGVVTGKVRVLRSPADAALLEPGEVLVARATDPGWTPLFLKAGGVVMELGGMLSHGAVIAREYNLPAVVNIPGVTKALRTGQEVTMDGRQGAIWLIPDSGPTDA